MEEGVSAVAQIVRAGTSRESYVARAAIPDAADRHYVYKQQLAGHSEALRTVSYNTTYCFVQYE